MQGTFDFYRDLPVRPKRPDRLFFALFPDIELSHQVERIGLQFIRDHHLEGARIARDRLHLSLQHVGDYARLRTKFEHAAKQAGGAVATRPFEVEFRFIKTLGGAPSIDGTPRRRPLVLLGQAEALRELHSGLGSAMRKNGLRGTDSFTPHMTLHYGPSAVPLQAIEPVRFAVREFTLVHSELGHSHYNKIERWRLRE